MCRKLAIVGAFLVSGHAVAQPPPRPWLAATLVYETGPAYVAQNDGEYGATGTRYDADDVGQRDNLVVSSRMSLELAIRRHSTATCSSAMSCSWLGRSSIIATCSTDIAPRICTGPFTAGARFALADIFGTR